MIKKILLITAAGVIMMVGGCAAVIATVISGANSATSMIRDDLMYQCDSAMGPDPSTTSSGAAEPTTAAAAPAVSSTTTPVPHTTATRSPATETYPSTNPYASLTDLPTSMPTRVQLCLQHMSTAPYQRPPVTTRAITTAGREAAHLANTLITDQVLSDTTAGSLQGPTDHKISQVWAVRWIMHTVAGLDLPATLPELQTTGQRVAPTAISAGDLIFCDFTGTGARRVLIAISQTVAASVPTTTGQPATLVTIPDKPIVVKRVLDVQAEEGYPR